MQWELEKYLLQLYYILDVHEPDAQILTGKRTWIIMKMMQILTTTFKEFQLTFFASVDTYQFENMTRSQSYQSYCFCLSWGSRWRWLLPLDSLTTTWRAWRSRRRDDKKDPTVNNILDNYSFQHWNLCLAAHRWPWETICWHVFLQEVQIMRSELRIKDCDNCSQLSFWYIPNKYNFFFWYLFHARPIEVIMVICKDF